MGHVGVHDRLLVLYAHDIADKSQIQRLLECAEVRRIAKHMPHRDHHARLALALKQVETLLLGLRHWFFEKYVVALAHRLHRRLVVEVVGKRHEHDVRQLAVLPRVKQLVEVAETPLRRDAPFVAHVVATRGVDVRDRNHPHRSREQLSVSGVLVAARSRAHDRHG